MKHVWCRRGFAVSSFLLAEIDFCKSAEGEEWQVGYQTDKEK